MMQFKRYIFFLVLLIWTVQAVFAQQSEIDSLIQAVKILPEDTNKVNEMNALVWQLKFVPNPEDKEKAIKLGDESFELAVKLNFDKGAAYAKKNVGAVYYYGGNYEKTKQYYKESLKYFEKINNKKGIAIAHSNLGNIFYQESNWKVALEHYLKSLALREEIGDKKGVAKINGAIGLLYLASKDEDTDKAIGYLRKSLKTYTELQDSSQIAASYLYIGNYFYSQFDTDSVKLKTLQDSALWYFKKSKYINEKLNTPRAYHNIGAIDDAIGSVMSAQNNDSALFYFENSLKIRQATENKYGMAGSCYNLARYYNAKGNIPKALKYVEKAYNIANEIGATAIERDVSQMLATLYYQTGKYKQSAEFYANYNILNDSLRNDENTKRMTELAMQYEFDKEKKAEELEQAKKDALHEAQIKQQKKIQNYLLIGFGILVLFLIYVLKSYRDKKKANKMLSEMNNEILDKNFMLNQQNEEIEAQRDEIELQRDQVIAQRDKIAQQNKHITDSIVYAQRIQQAVMPPDEYFNKILHEYFILFKPRDIVSGDYYWATQKDNKIILTAADCTGHGVPGAFMSLLGISFLNEIVNKIRTTEGEPIQANQILNQLRDTIKKSLRQTGKFTDSKDGMDMALCVIDPDEMSMQFAGANNPVLIVRDGELIQYKPDKMPVGVHYKEKPSFTNHDIELKKGDAVYMFSDGYIDQFGGEKGRKFMIKRFKEYIMEIYDKPMQEQKELLLKRFKEWQEGDGSGHEYHQIDDVLVIGFRI